jgi:hypothetical protein
MDSQAQDLIMYWAHKSKAEVAGVFQVELKEGDNGAYLWCHTPTLLKQTVHEHGLHFSFDPEALLKWQEEHLKFGDNGEMSYSNWGTFHSHDTAGVHFSEEDHDLPDDHGGRGYYVNIVVNKREDVYCRVDTFVGSPKIHGATRVEVPCSYEVATALDSELSEWADKLFDECVEYESPGYMIVQRGDYTSYPTGKGLPTRLPTLGTDLVCTICDGSYEYHQAYVRKLRESYGTGWHAFHGMTLTSWLADCKSKAKRAKKYKAKGHKAANQWRAMAKKADAEGASTLAGEYLFFKALQGLGGVYFYKDGKVRVQHDTWQGPKVPVTLTPTIWKEIEKVATKKLVDTVKEVSLVT